MCTGVNPSVPRAPHTLPRGVVGFESRNGAAAFGNMTRVVPSRIASTQASSDVADRPRCRHSRAPQQQTDTEAVQQIVLDDANRVRKHATRNTTSINVG